MISCAACDSENPEASLSCPVCRFIPGTLLADRYRVVGLGGKGGMGELYRSDDLELGHVVAMKFIPPAASAEAIAALTIVAARIAMAGRPILRGDLLEG